MTGGPQAVEVVGTELRASAAFRGSLWVSGLEKVQARLPSLQQLFSDDTTLMSWSLVVHEGEMV